MTAGQIIARSERMPEHGGQIEGTSPLTGHLSLPALLVREAVQNSWDARDDHRQGSVRFEIEGRDLDAATLDHMASLLPIQDLPGFERTSDSDEALGVLHPRAVLARSSVRALTISDRNTVGLCGPSRSGHRWQPALRHGRQLLRPQQRFANFVRNTGRATAQTGSGDGGAYGVGKSALWMASECGTILIHTRTTDEHGWPIERFISVVHGEHFYGDDGFQYTGRHFIGHDGGDGVIEPLVGADAARATRGLGIPSYELDGQVVDGTTIIILAPRLQLDWEAEMQRFRDAMRWHVWPKRVPDVRAPNTPADMEMSLSLNGTSVCLPSPLEDPEIRPYAMALRDCARERLSEEADRDYDIRSYRPKKKLGDLKFRTAGPHDDNVFHKTSNPEDLLENPSDPAAHFEAEEIEPIVDFERPWGQIALIRRDPLLLVRYESIGGPDATSNLIGVFLSAKDDEVERALTNAEPPAHDDWIDKIVPKDDSRDHRRTYVKRTLAEIRGAKAALIKSFRGSGAGGAGGGEQNVSKRISPRIFAGTEGKKKPPPRPKPGSVRARRPTAVLTPIQTSREDNDTIHELEVTLKGVGGSPNQVTLTASGSGVDSDGSMKVAAHTTFTWVTTDGRILHGDSLSLQAVDQTRLSLIIRLSSNLRFRPRVTVEVSNEP